MKPRAFLLLLCGITLASLLGFLVRCAVKSRFPLPSDGSKAGPTERSFSGSATPLSIGGPPSSSAPASTLPSEAATFPNVDTDGQAGLGLNGLPPSTVVTTWKNNAESAGFANSDIERVTQWLQHVLSHRHRKIDNNALDDFARSVRAFPEGTGIVIGGKENRNATDLMKFCTSVAWGEKSATDVNAADVMQQLDGINAKTLGKVAKTIESSLPPEKETKWQPEIERDIEALSTKIERREEQLTKDFLFPAFKRPLTKIQQDEADAWLKRPNVVPTYGSIDQVMQTPDEAFEIRLQRFAQAFDSYYLFALAAQQIILVHEASHDWYKFDVSLLPPSGTWAVVPRLELPTIPATSEAEGYK